MAVTIGIGGLLVSGASTVKTMNDASDAKAQQKKDNEAAAAQQKKLEAEANQKLKDQQTIESATATRSSAWDFTSRRRSFKHDLDRTTRHH